MGLKKLLKVLLLNKPLSGIWCNLLFKITYGLCKKTGSKYAGEYYKVEEIMEKYHVTR